MTCATIHATEAGIHYLRGLPNQALEHIDAALAVTGLTQARAVQRLAWPLMMKAILLPMLGQFSEFDEFERKLTAERGASLPITRMVVRQYSEFVALARRGDLQQFLTTMEELARLAREGAGGFYEAMLAAAHVYLGNTEAAIEHGHLGAVRTLVTRGLNDEASFMETLAWTGREDEAREVWARISAHILSAKHGDTAHWKGLLATWVCATALPLLGERRACADLYPALDALAAAGFVSAPGPGPTSPHLAAAISAECGDRIDAARTHYDEALRLAHSLPDRLLQPAVRMWYGRFLVAQGTDEATRGLSYLREAVADFAALGMPLHVARATDWLREADSSR